MEARDGSIQVIGDICSCAANAYNPIHYSVKILAYIYIAEFLNLSITFVWLTR